MLNSTLSTGTETETTTYAETYIGQANRELKAAGQALMCRTQRDADELRDRIVRYIEAKAEVMRGYQLRAFDAEKYDEAGTIEGKLEVYKDLANLFEQISVA